MKSPSPTLPVLLVLACLIQSATAQKQMETLNRGVVAVRASATQAYIGWRLLGTDPDDVSFNLYRVRSGVTNLLNGSPITASCNHLDTPPNFSAAISYFVRPVVGGIEQAASASFTIPASVPERQYLTVPLQIPPDGTTVDGPYSYTANDCGVADLDGDGDYEIVLKWEPTNAKDNSQSGHTGNVFLDAYQLDGTHMWRIDLGRNIRAGAHYTQFMVYDLDGNGRAEVACRTAPGTRDGLGDFVLMGADNPNIVYTNSSGYILTGPEYLTIFDGVNGTEVSTTAFLPDRVNVSQWGDSYGNRVDRFLAGIAYLDGVRPSLIMARGYYGPQSGGGQSRNEITAWNWRNGQLTLQWWFKAGLNINGNTNSNYIGQGNHQLSIADVDGDGRDEIIYGACAIDDNGAGLYSMGLGHGDALHVSDLDPLRPGLERWGIHEGTGTPGSAFTATATGEILWQTPNADVGRGVAADLTAAFPGYEMWGGTSGLRSTDNQSAGDSPSSSNFAVWWDADLLRELEDGTSVTKYGGGTLLSAAGTSSNNGTKSTPALSADLFGDWREEVMWRSSDNSELRIYTTINVAANRIPTLMHDPQYRVAVAWQNVAYNQPPHPGFFLGDGMAAVPRYPVSDAAIAWRGGNGSNSWTAANNWFVNGIWISDVMATYSPGNPVVFDLRGAGNPVVNLTGSVSPSQLKVQAPVNYTFSGTGSLAGTMKLIKAGRGRLTIANTNSYSGATLVGGGSLFVNGRLDSSPVTVERRGEPQGFARFGGGGHLGAGLTLQQGCGLIVGSNTNATGMLAVAGTVTQLGDVLNEFDLSNDPTGLVKSNDVVEITGNLSLAGVNVIRVTQLDGNLGNGVYPLFKYSGSLTGSLGNFVLTGDFIQPVALTNPPGQIALVASLPASPPVAPSGLVATAAGSFQIDLVWQDNSADETVFLIERSTNNVTFAQVGEVAENVTSFPDTGLQPATTYYYRVSATNLAGASGYTTDSATTTVLPAQLTWRGDGVGNVWDRAGMANWFNGTTLGVYDDGVDVVFDQTGSNSPAIDLVELVQPASVTVNASKNYTIGGAGSLDGPMSLIKSGTGSLTMSLANSFFGGVTMNSGSLVLVNTLGAGLGPIRFNGGSVTFNLNNQQNYANPLEVMSDGTLVSSGGNNNIVSGAWSGPGGSTLNLGMATGTFTVSGNMNNFFGTLALGSSGGFFRFNNSSANVAFGSPNTTYDLGTGTTTLVNRNGGITISLGALAGGPGTVLSGRSSSSGGSGSTYQIGGKNLSTTFNGTVQNGNDTVSITKVGAGILTLTGANTYGGLTTVNGGTLHISGDHSAAIGDVVVGSTGALGGTGVVGGNTTVNGTLAAGASIGTLTFLGDLTLSTNSTAVFEILKVPLENDKVVVAGTLTLGGTLTLVNSGVELLEAGDSFDLLDAANTEGGFTGYDLPALEPGLVWETSALANNGILSVVAPSQPVISKITVTGGNVVLSGSNGVSGATYHLMSSTNVGQPFSQWTRLRTNQFDANGTFVITNAMVPGSPRAFYSIEVP